MILADKEDVIKTLKRFKGLSKQALLVAQSMPGNDGMLRHAQSRKDTYEKVMSELDGSSVREALDRIIREYMNCLAPTGSAEAAGRELALEYSLQAFGMTDKAISALRMARAAKRNIAGGTRVVGGA